MWITEKWRNKAIYGGLQYKSIKMENNYAKIVDKSWISRINSVGKVCIMWIIYLGQADNLIHYIFMVKVYVNSKT